MRGVCVHAFCFASVSQGASIAMQLTCELKLLRLKPTDQMTKPISPSEIFRSCYDSRLTRWTGWNSLSFADHNASTGQMARAGKGKGENHRKAQARRCLRAKSRRAELPASALSPSNLDLASSRLVSTALSWHTTLKLFVSSLFYSDMLSKLYLLVPTRPNSPRPA